MLARAFVCGSGMYIYGHAFPSAQIQIFTLFPFNLSTHVMSKNLQNTVEMSGNLSCMHLIHREKFLLLLVLTSDVSLSEVDDFMCR